MALYDYEKTLRPTQGPSQLLPPGGMPRVPDGLRRAFQLPNYPLAAATASPDDVPAAPNLPLSGLAQPASAQPATETSLRAMSPAVPVSQPENPVAQVRAVDNNVANSAAIANPASVLPASYAAAGSVQSLNNPDALGQINRDIAHQQSLQRLRNPNDPTPGMTVMDAGVADARQKFFDEANLRNAAARGSWSPRKGFQGDDDAVKAAMAPIQTRARLAELSLKNAGDQSIAQMRDTTDRRGQDIAAQTASLRDATDRRGQDVTARGQDMTARTAAATARLDQMNKDRQFGLDVQKYGQDVASKNFDIRVKAQKDVTDQVTSMLPPGADGKPDTANAARYTAGLNTLVAQRTEQLRAQLARTPGRKDVADELEALESRGLAAMDQAAVRKYIVGQQAADLAKETGTGRFTPWGTDAANSSAPITSLREDKGLFGSDYVSDRGDRIPARYLRQDGKLNQDLRTLIQK